MSSKRSWVLTLTGAGVLLIAVLAFAFPTAAVAQCGTPQKSTCFTCHAHMDPMVNKGEWHIVHASKDICINCHGGNGTSLDPAVAHAGMTAHPLSDAYTDCHSCHPDDYMVRAQHFASTLGETAGSCTTPTPVPAAAVSNEPVAFQPALVGQVSQRPSAPSIIFGVSVAVFGLGLVVTLILRRL